MNYIDNVPRVSDLVSYIYPFEGTDSHKRFQNWLSSLEIDEYKYMNDACSFGTMIHSRLENYIKGNMIIGYPMYIEKELKFGKEYIDGLSPVELIETERYVKEKNNRFQGTLDLLYKKDGKYVIGDFKTYGIAKKQYGLDNKFAVPLSKRKKVQVQMSFYAYRLAQDGIDVSSIELIFLHNEGCRVYELDILSKEEIEIYLAKYESRNDNLSININDMKIEIRVPTTQYGYINIELDLSKTDNGKTSQENIDRAIARAKYTRDKYNNNL